MVKKRDHKNRGAPPKNRGAPPKNRGAVRGFTAAEQKIKELILDQGYSQRKAARRLKINRSTVWSTLQRVKKKMMRGPPPPFSPPFKGGIPHKIRLHGEQYVANILYKFPRYDKVRQRSPSIVMGGYKILLHKKRVELYCNNDYWGMDTDEATKKSLDAFYKVIVKLENDAGILLIKDRYHNIRRVKSHYAEVNNELAEDCRKKEEKIQIRAPEDGKTWLLIDNSLDFNEMETVHPQTSKEDMDKLKPFFDDLRNFDPAIFTRMANMLETTTLMIKEMAYHNKQSAAGLEAVIEVIKPKNDKKRPAEPEPDPSYIG